MVMVYSERYDDGNGNGDGDGDGDGNGSLLKPGLLLTG